MMDSKVATAFITALPQKGHDLLIPVDDRRPRDAGAHRHSRMVPLPIALTSRLLHRLVPEIGPGSCEAVVVKGAPLLRRYRLWQ